MPIIGTISKVLLRNSCFPAQRDMIFNRIFCTSQPWLRKWANKAGSNWRNLALAALLGTSTHQV